MMLKSIKKLLYVCVLAACMSMPVVALANDKTELSEQNLESNAQNRSGFTWSASAVFSSNYIWRGLNCGGPSLHLDATVDYKGLFANVWWNVGATDWTFTGFNPEVDITLGYSRWGVTVMYMHMYYFDHYQDGTMSKFFDFKNHEPGGGGTTGEWRVLYGAPVYTSPKGLTTSINALCGVRTFGRDGYYEAIGDEAMRLEGDSVLKRAYSTYIEVGFDQELGADWTLAARLGITPAKSLYTGFQGDFAVTLVGLKLSKTWTLNYGTLNAFANVMLQPWQLNADNLIRPIAEAGNQKLNLSVGVGWSI